MLSFKDVPEVRQFVTKQGIAFISFYVSDIDGRFRNVTIPAENFTDKTVTEGIGIDASSLGFATVDLSLHMLYDPARDGSPVEYANRILQEFSTAPLPEGYAMIAAFTHLFADPAIATTIFTTATFAAGHCVGAARLKIQRSGHNRVCQSAHGKRRAWRPWLCEGFADNHELQGRFDRLIDAFDKGTARCIVRKQTCRWELHP